jgi:putative tricarboxylic transport membrane protein
LGLRECVVFQIGSQITSKFSNHPLVVEFIANLTSYPVLQVQTVMGLFGVEEVLSDIEQSMKREIFKTKISHLLPTVQDWVESKWALVRGTLTEFFLGLLPGGGTVLSSFASYAIEKRFSKTPEKFGSGMVAGAAGPEAPNNAATCRAFIPLLSLGIPGTAVMAIMLGPLILHGIQPGPLLIKDHPSLSGAWCAVCILEMGRY